MSTATELLSLRDVADIRGVNRSTVWDWTTRGLLADGQRVRLESQMIAGTLLTTREKLNAFVQATTPEQE